MQQFAAENFLIWSFFDGLILLGPPGFILETKERAEMEFLDIILTKDSRVFCSTLFTVPSTGGF
jgi:hypothetical protein